MTPGTSLLQRVNVGLFVLVLVTGGVLFVAADREEVSEGEKRVLARMPQISWDKVSDRQFFRDIDDFVADNFPFRTALTELSGEIRSWRGWLSDDIQIFTNATRKAARPAGPGQDGPADEAPLPDPALAPAVELPSNSGSEPSSSVTDEPARTVQAPSAEVSSAEARPAEEPAIQPAPQDGASVPSSGSPTAQTVSGEQPTDASGTATPASTEIRAAGNDPAQAPPVSAAEPVAEAGPALAVPLAALPPATDPPVTAPPVTAPPVIAPPLVSQPAVPSASESKALPAQDPYQVIEAVIVYRGRALQIMGGTPAMASPMVQAVNRYQQELGPDVTVYFMAAPIGSDFYLPEKINRGVMKEKILIDSIHARLNPPIRPVPAYDHLAAHVEDYLYFNTDHHWTGLGAYYAYQAFAKTAGFAPLPLSALSKHEINSFLGTLYYRTMSPALKVKGDKVEYYKIPNRTEVTVFNAGWRAGYSGQLYVETAKGGNAYGVFLGGDAPLMRIRSDVTNNRKIVVIKDSYGNAFVPYLAAHYQEVYVIDYRSFKGNIKNLIRDQGIQDVLFAHNTFVVASGYAAQQAILFLNNPNP